jgi:hypothetical protein
MMVRGQRSWPAPHTTAMEPLVAKGVNFTDDGLSQPKI